MDKERRWLLEERAHRCVGRLNRHRFDARFFEERGLFLAEIKGVIKEAKTVGFGGSATLRSLGLAEMADVMGKEVLDHGHEGLSFEESLAARRGQQRCDLFFTSANALSETGEIVNVDGIGNRTNAMCFGPKRVVVVAGFNKIAPDLSRALERVRQVAGPMRAKSLGVDTPCAQTGVCSDCNAPMRICNITTVLHRKPMLTDVSVFVVGEELGY